MNRNRRNTPTREGIRDLLIGALAAGPEYFMQRMQRFGLQDRCRVLGEHAVNLCNGASILCIYYGTRRRRWTDGKSVDLDVHVADQVATLLLEPVAPCFPVGTRVRCTRKASQWTGTITGPYYFGGPLACKVAVTHDRNGHPYRKPLNMKAWRHNLRVCLPAEDPAVTPG